MGASRSRRLRAAIAACGLVLAASAGRADQTGGGSLRGRGPGCPDHKACFEGFANRQHRLRTIVSGFRETRTVPGGTPVVTSGRFSWRAPGNPTWQVERGSSRSEGKPDAGRGEFLRFEDHEKQGPALLPRMLVHYRLDATGKRILQRKVRLVQISLGAELRVEDFDRPRRKPS